MSKLEEQQHILNELAKKYGLEYEKVLKQSQKVDKLMTKAMKEINNIR